MSQATEKHKGFRRLNWEDVMIFVDKHPRTGWFLSSLMLLNTILNLVTIYIVS